MRKKFVSFLTILFLASSVVFGQTVTISGKVVDEAGNGVPFPTIQSGNTGVSGAADGSFTIKVERGAALKVSSVGFQTKEVVASDDRMIIQLEKATETIEEVVVTGAYGIRRTSRSTSYNAQVVAQEQLNTIRQTNLNNAIAGKVAGVQVRSQSAAAMGRTGNIRLRGVSGLGGDQDVLYVVDGTILPSPDGINIDDIEDITVLQGPAASAQFGSQGSNGAIVITTKKGRLVTKGIGVDVNTGAQFDNVYVMPNYQNSYAGGSFSDMLLYRWQPGQPEEWKALDGKYYHNYEDDASWGPRMVGQEYIPWYAWYPGTEYSYKTAKLVPQPDNAKDFFRTGVTLNNSVSLTKVTENANIRMSYGNIYVQGIIPTSSLNKNTFSFSGSIDLNAHLTASANINYITSTIRGQVEDDNYSNQSTGSFNQWFHRDLDMGIMKELKDLKTPEGVYASWNHMNPGSYDASNPRGFYAGNYWYNFYTWFDLVKQITSYDRFYGDASVTYKIIPGLNFKGTYRKQQVTTWSEQKFSSALATSGLQTSGNNPQTLGYYETGQTYSNRENFEMQVSYSKKIQDFSINANAGSDFFRWNFKQNSGNTEQGLVIPDLFTLANSKSDPSISNIRIQEKYKAVYLLGNIGYKNLIFADFSLRNDWYSTLPQNNNDVFSKSFGGSFVFSDLLKDFPFLSFGKIRGSWGEIPLALGPSSYGGYSTYFGAYRYPGASYVLNPFQWDGNILMAAPDQLVDSSIQGSVKSQWELGLDLRFLKNRVGVSFTYWKGKEKDIPTSVTINGASGYTSLLTNSAEISKEGIDMQVSLRPLWMRNFKWEFNATWGLLLDNKVVQIAPDYGVTQTNAINAMWGTTGPYMVHTAGKQWGQLYGNGMKRINGQPVIDDDGNYVNDPNVYFGSVLPKYTGGVQNSFEIYNDFVVNVNIDYQVGGKFFSLSDMWGSYSGLTARTAAVNDKGNPIRDPVAEGGGVHVFGVDEEGKPKDVYVEAQDYFHNLYNSQTFDPFIYNLTFVKLREVSVGYKIPVEKLGIQKVVQSATFSVVGRNLALLYAQTKDFDPAEISYLSGEAGQFPATRGIGFNLKVSF